MALISREVSRFLAEDNASSLDTQRLSLPAVRNFKACSSVTSQFPVEIEFHELRRNEPIHP